MSDLKAYLGGLIDGEAWIGLVTQKHKNARFGFDFSPQVIVAVHISEEHALRKIVNELGFGRVVKKPSRPFSVRLQFTRRHDVQQIIDMVENEVRFNSSQRRIHLMKQLLSIIGYYNRNLTASDYQKIIGITGELRSMSKRVIGTNRTSIEELEVALSRVRPGARDTNEAMKRNEKTKAPILRAEVPKSGLGHVP